MTNEPAVGPMEAWLTVTGRAQTLPYDIVQQARRVDAEIASLQAQNCALREALVAASDASATKNEYYNQCDLGLTPSKGWRKLDFEDVIQSQAKADGKRIALLSTADNAGCGHAEEVARLRNWLILHGQHLRSCPQSESAWGQDRKACTCGLSSALDQQERIRDLMYAAEGAGRMYHGSEGHASSFEECPDKSCAVVASVLDLR